MLPGRLTQLPTWKPSNLNYCSPTCSTLKQFYPKQNGTREGRTRKRRADSTYLKSAKAISQKRNQSERLISQIQSKRLSKNLASFLRSPFFTWLTLMNPILKELANWSKKFVKLLPLPMLMLLPCAQSWRLNLLNLTMTTVLRCFRMLAYVNQP